MSTAAPAPTPTPPEPTPKQVYEALYDGADLTVEQQDGSRQVVKVRKIPRSEFTQYAMVVGDETAAGDRDELKLYIPDRPDAWWDSLTEQSLDDIMAEGIRLNFPAFARWWRRRARDFRLVQNDPEAARQSQALIETHTTPPDSRTSSPPPVIRVPSNGPGPRRS